MGEYLSGKVLMLVGEAGWIKETCMFPMIFNSHKEVYFYYQHLNTSNNSKHSNNNLIIH